MGRGLPIGDKGPAGGFCTRACAVPRACRAAPGPMYAVASIPLLAEKWAVDVA